MKPKAWTLIQDIDGCLADFNSAFMDLLVDVNGPPPKPLKLECWHWPTDECGYTEEQVDKAWEAVDRKWWETLDPLPGAVKALDRIWWMEKEGLITPYFVTGRLPWARLATCSWLNEHGGFAFPQVICTSKKDLIAQALGGPVAVVEDKPSIMERYGPSGVRVEKLYGIAYNYNQGIAGVQYVADTFEALMDLEKTILNEKAPTQVEA